MNPNDLAKTLSSYATPKNIAIIGGGAAVLALLGGGSDLLTLALWGAAGYLGYAYYKRLTSKPTQSESVDEQGLQTAKE